jgi:hypothetical protein
MRLGGATILLAFLFGAFSAFAQESPGIIPGPVQPAEKSKPVHVVPKKLAAAKQAAPKTAAPTIAAPATVPAKSAALEAQPAKADPAPEAPSAGISGNDRLKIQSALAWSGDYTGSLGGEDPFLVPQTRDATRGTRWSSAHGEVQVETFRIDDPDLKLSALFEQQKREPSSRKVEYSVLRDDNFYISGMQGLKKFSVRAQLRNGEVRGFTILFDQMMETIVAPVTVAMASAFSPFPEGSAPFAAMAKSVEYGNGLVVSARGHIVTDRKLTTGCQVIVAAGIGDADRIAEDKDNGLALLRVYGPRKLSPLALAPDAAKKGDVTLIGIPDPKDQSGAKKLTEIKARLAGANAIELRQPVPMAGFSGAATLGAQGQFLGMMQMRDFVLAGTEASAPPVRLVTAPTIRDFLVAHNVAPVSQGSDAKASIVRIICVRK